MAKFSLQNIQGSRQTFANSENIQHVMTATTQITDAGTKGDLFPLVRSTVSVTKLYGVKTGCTDCKKLRRAACRIDISIPQEIDDPQVYVKEVLLPAIAAVKQRIEAGVLRGFAVTQLDVAGSYESVNVA